MPRQHTARPIVPRTERGGPTQLLVPADPDARVRLLATALARELEVWGGGLDGHTRRVLDEVEEALVGVADPVPVGAGARRHRRASNANSVGPDSYRAYVPMTAGEPEVFVLPADPDGRIAAACELLGDELTDHGTGESWPPVAALMRLRRRITKALGFEDVPSR